MKSNIPFKLYSGLGISIFLVLLVGYFSIDTLNNQVERTTHLIKIKKSISEVQDLEYNIAQMRSARFKFWIDSKDADMTNYVLTASAIKPIIIKLQLEFQNNISLTNKINSLDTSLTALYLFWDSEGKIEYNHSRNTVKDIAQTEEIAFQKIFPLIDRIKQALILELDTTEKKIEESFSFSTKLILGGIILLIGIVLILVNAVIATLKSRFRSERRLKETVAKMEDINQLATEKNKLLEGVSYINDHIQKSNSLFALSTNVIRSVVGYLEVPAGVIYIKNEKTDFLEMTAGVAVSADAKVGFKIGEGIIGNAALQREAVSISDVPADYWHVETALGDMTGKGEILCMPLWLDNELKGLIELGIFGKFSAHQKNLLENIAHNVASAIQAEQARAKINDLLAEVQEHKDSLVKQQEELRQTNNELSRQAKELQETSKYKSEFLANMSHELRTPLNSVLILAKLLADNNPRNLTDKQIEYATIIHRSGSDLLKLINDILDLSKIEAGKIDLTIEEISVESIIKDLQQLFSVVASQKNIEFSIHKDVKVPNNLKTDVLRLEQIIKNLLSNAFKFTPENGKVSVLFNALEHPDGKRISIQVKDSGIGISAEKQKLIFDAFQQADGSTSRKYGGTGLGLSISKELARLLGGEIMVSSKEGMGSEFTVIVPVATTESNFHQKEELKTIEAPELDNIEEQDKVSDDRNNLKDNDEVILIIEDDENFATIVRDFARNKNFKTIIALSGDEGLFYAKKYRLNAIILDVQLPVLDGWSLLKILKEDPETKHIPVHIISAFDDNRFNSGGALAYVKKPINLEGLNLAFNKISTYIKQNFKSVLLVSPDYFQDKNINAIFQQRLKSVTFYNASSINEARGITENKHIDCIIVDLGNEWQENLTSLQDWRSLSNNQHIPFILLINNDIPEAEENKLKPFAEAIVRNDLSVNDNLITELDSFLYQVKKSEKSTLQAIINESTLMDLSGFKILIVDDDMRNVYALSTALESENADIISASDGRESLEMLKIHADTDLVLMDIMMPEMDGYEAMSRIRKELKQLDLPIIALTAKAMEGDREKCISAGASDYITKPVDIQKLISTIKSWLSK
ncbi:response regulator [Sediminibacterium sp. TEGAF015]|uniref:response regulator n=1 Tax=Sediminibacterium sp. TEGAF015 TaxID=575378 RepID=UPI002207B321|nr:response regulator [Sediminibacterium sp. TEGAF015]BDQ11377.1 histidine kinase [Sediminibacterium sp. TEGAF015]